MQASQIPLRSKDYSGWYNALIKQANLAEHGPAHGSMIIKPYGYAIWEKIQTVLDQAFKAQGYMNAYFPLLIPKSYLSREAAHVAGFAKECAVVTHYRLKTNEDRTELHVDPAAKLEEELVIRPTSEAIVWNTYKRWIRSYRDLPLCINQWNNVVRWEMRTRLFIRSSEILWQEGHTAHATAAEAEATTQQVLVLYRQFARDYLAIPFLSGLKPAHEQFAGAEQTYTVEALMQDGKALQAGTSHFLGQRFSKAFGVTFSDASGKLQHAWGTSWGVTTRLIGALIMVHGDDRGLVLPPRLAPTQVVMIPIYKGDEGRVELLEQMEAIKQQLLACGVSVHLDDDPAQKPGWKFAEYELKGVPLRLVMGPRDLANQTIELYRRDTREKQTIGWRGLVQVVEKTLADIQANLYQRALEFRKRHTHMVDTYADFQAHMAERGGLVYAHWDGTTETAQRIQTETKATIRCIPSTHEPVPGRCIYTGNPSTQRVVFAQAY